ncbi:MAG TPA: PQQ-dependent sugar dehydrogenase [Gemmatimonadales bacterium]|nr:PQQ-dependent sugar dehydrogenase [Gemmatimonadales bacterium]HRZ08579.1 PQQ-dependent sugar dehydrogenase [Gemmatimonadales bacterium]
MRRLFRSFAAAPAFLGLVMTCGGDSAGTTLPPGAVSVRLEEVASGLAYPVYLTAAPGDTSRLFVVEKGGTVRVLKHGVLLPTPFIDLSGRVTKGSEQGLLGMAFHPSDNRVVLSFTVAGPERGGRSRVATFTPGADPDVLDPASEQLVIEVDQPYSNHNGGHVAFGPDGYLYFGLGDGGSGGDPQGHGQDRSDLLGSLLRLDLDHGLPYTVPASNPFVGQAGVRGELWNWGLRNPWRFSFDRANGNLYIADVGQNEWEEVDVQPAASQGGENYGWAVMEGEHCYGSATCDKTGLVMPVIEYGHGDGCSITGGYVYRGQAIPELAGTYFYGDYCDGWIRSFVYQGGTATNTSSWPSLDTGQQITSFGEDARGEIYVVLAGGTIYRIAPGR